jgi:hypothetical protein
LGVQLRQCGIGGNRRLGIVAEPLQSPVPNVSQDIVLRAGLRHKKWNAPTGSHQEADVAGISRFG